MIIEPIIQSCLVATRIDLVRYLSGHGVPAFEQEEALRNLGHVLPAFVSLHVSGSCDDDYRLTYCTIEDARAAALELFRHAVLHE